MESLGALYVSLAQDFGWSMEQIGGLTIRDIEFIRMGWRQHPPLQALVAGFMGVKTEKPKRASRESLQEFAQFIGSK